MKTQTSMWTWGLFSIFGASKRQILYHCFRHLIRFFGTKKHILGVQPREAAARGRWIGRPTNHSAAPAYISPSRSEAVLRTLSLDFESLPLAAPPIAMSETAPAETAAPAPVEKAPAKKKAAKKAAGGAAKRKASGPPVSELITKAVAASKERSGVSLAALKKALAAAGYDVDKNNSRIKLGLKTLVSKGTLVQTKGTGASGSFKLNKKAASGEAKPKPKKAGAAKLRKPAGSTPKKPKKAAGAKKAVKKTPKKVKKPASAGVKKVAKSPKKAKAAAKPKKAAKSPAKPKAVKPKAAKPKAAKPKAAKPKAAKAKKAAPKKK
ncbi:uncharacterized protein RBU33_012538 [Hipposideros larvatus]